MAVGKPGDTSHVDRTVKVRMLETDDGRMIFEPSSLDVRRGETIRFALVNDGVLEHEFVLDDLAKNQEHKKLMERFPNLSRVCITLRGSLSASHNTWSAVLFDGERLYTGPAYDITHIVDRVGGGDSFAGGLIYALLAGRDDQAALDFAVAASCLKHSIAGDANRVSVDEVESLLQLGGSGRVQR